MKVNRIKIQSFRGIVNFDQELNLKTKVVTGPNGTGKSGIIDAFDFLLTGDLQRLRGEGTKEITLDIHGRHIDKDIKDVYVEAEIECDKKQFSVRRNLKDKKITLLKGDKDAFEKIVPKMNAGQFLLSRRELLKFIACTGQKRSEEIQAMLDVSGVEKIRKDLASFLSSMTTKMTGFNVAIDSSLKTTNTYLDLATNANSQDRRKKINAIRSTLGKPEIQEWTEETDIVHDVPTIPETSNTQHKKDAFTKLIDDIQPDRNKLITDEKGVTSKARLIKICSAVQTINDFTKLVESNQLISLGVNLIGEGKLCPLCDTPWLTSSLVAHLQEKKKISQEAIELKNQFSKESSTYIAELSHYSKKISALLPTVQSLKDEGLETLIKTVAKEIDDRCETLKEPIKSTKLIALLSKEINLIDLSHWKELQASLTTFADTLPVESKEESAFKKLHQVATLFKTVLETSKALKAAKNKAELMKKISEHFNSSRESFFETLFSAVEQDFIRYYKFLNQDEDKFSAKLVDQEKAVDLKVDFYDRGLHPPHALHSEGHQDSMGICLFLALMKKIKGTDFSLALLDDVMMSIDSGHRRRLCELLKTEFPDTQFVITTHDPVWARQLKEFGVVTGKNLYHFKNWSLETGPVFEAKEVWEILREKANSGNIHDAAAGLRRNLELEFQDICTNLMARVPFRTSHSWALGELKDAAISAFKSNLAKAKDAANSWGNKDSFGKIMEISNKLDNAIKHSKSDQWQINPAVHYNQWANFTKEDILPLIDSMEELIRSFGSTDDSKFYLSTKPGSENPMSLTSLDGTMNFTLAKKD